MSPAERPDADRADTPTAAVKRAYHTPELQDLGPLAETTLNSALGNGIQDGPGSYS